MGDFVRSLHESHGVIFHLEDSVTAIDAKRAVLKSGGLVEADLVVVGVGVRPRLALAEQAGLDVKQVAEALSTGAVASPQVIRHSKRMAARDFSGATFTSALRHKDAAYAVRLAETLLSGVPVSRAALAAYEAAKAHAPDGDEGQMIEIVSKPR